jgi:hypothetical protein
MNLKEWKQIMQLKTLKIYLLPLLLIATGFIACKKSDDEPILPPTRISRLYVSFSDLQTDDLAIPYNNIAVFDPADSASLNEPVYFNSQVKEGAGIYFSPYAKRVFQGSIKDFMIRTFSISLTGVLGPASSFTDTTLVSQPDLAYDHISTNLYVSNNLTNSIHVYAKGAQRSGVLKHGPNKRFELQGQPRGLLLDNDSLMVVLRSSEVNEIALLENPSKIDSGQVNGLQKITISGASDLRGITYSHKLNLLVLSDVATSTIYIIENAREAFTQNLTLTPTQTISGALTKIKNPIDVAIDDRDDKMFLYIADRAEGNKAILRFNLSDRGNVAPEAFYNLKLTPASIYLDAR